MAVNTVIYSAEHATEATGFSLYVLRVYRPKGMHARALVERVRRDPLFPRQIQTRATWELYLRHRPWPWAERRAGAEVWSRYAAWKRGQAKLAA